MIMIITIVILQIAHIINIIIVVLLLIIIILLLLLLLLSIIVIMIIIGDSPAREGTTEAPPTCAAGVAIS